MEFNAVRSMHDHLTLPGQILNLNISFASTRASLEADTLKLIHQEDDSGLRYTTLNEERAHLLGLDIFLRDFGPHPILIKKKKKPQVW